ncbi:MAG: hypothetical protein RLY87_1182 [Chloroflexota bacterium]|jgi:predicted DCC family thiol-disulfide oxidoreductase YuxK
MQPILLFDGVCNLCSGVVQWVIPRDPAGRIQFASLQSNAGQHYCARYGIDGTSLNSVVFIHEHIAYQESDAALMLISVLPGPLRHLSLLRVVPRFVRDPIYRWVARNRYAWFGKAESCMLSMPGYTERFIEKA